MNNKISSEIIKNEDGDEIMDIMNNGWRQSGGRYTKE